MEQDNHYLMFPPNLSVQVTHLLNSTFSFDYCILLLSNRFEFPILNLSELTRAHHSSWLFPFPPPPINKPLRYPSNEVTT